MKWAILVGSIWMGCGLACQAAHSAGPLYIAVVMTFASFGAWILELQGFPQDMQGRPDKNTPRTP